MGGNPCYSLVCKFLFGIDDSERSMLCEGLSILNSLLAKHSRLVLYILLPLYPFTIFFGRAYYSCLHCLASRYDYHSFLALFAAS